MCIVGSVVIVINAPEQSSVSTIQDMKGFILSPGFLSYAGVIIIGCISIIVWVAPKYGHQSMLVYISVCSLIGGLSVVATQGLGAAVVTQISGVPQFNQWFLYVLFVFIVITLVVEIIYLNVCTSILSPNNKANFGIESIKYFQRRARYTNILRLLHQLHNRNIRCSLPRV